MKDYRELARKYGILKKDIDEFIWLLRVLDVYKKGIIVAKKYNNNDKIIEYKREINKVLKILKSKYNYNVNNVENSKSFIK